MMNIDRDKLIEMAKEALFTISNARVYVKDDMNRLIDVSSKISHLCELVSAHAITSMQGDSEPVGYFYQGRRKQPNPRLEQWLSISKNDHWPVDQWDEITVTEVFTHDRVKGVSDNANAKDGYVLVPIEPSDEHIKSMVIRYDHALSLDGYYDTKPIQFGLSHAQKLEATITQMRQLYEEATGQGFFKIKAQQERN